MEKTQEREAKFQIEADAVDPDLTRLPAGLQVVERPSVRLSARYFDTAGLGLLRRGITLRHRRDMANDGENLWTLKLPDALEGTVLSRTELSWPGEEVNVPAEARRLLTAVIHEEELRAVAAFVTVRHRREVLDGTGRRLAEVDDDRVTVTSPTAKVFRQIEVELDAGDTDLIAQLSKVLRRSGASRDDTAGKLHLALADRISELELTPRPSAEPMTLGELFRTRVVSSLDKLVAHDIGLRLERRTEDVHQSRVASRRLRSDIKTFGAILDRDWAAETTEELRWWGGVLGAVRDLDVLGDRIAGHSTGPDDPDADGFAAVAVRLAAQRAAAWERLEEALNSDRYEQLLLRLDAATVHPPLAQAGPQAPISAGRGAVEGIAPLVRQPWRRLRQTVRRLPRHPSDDELHRVRIRAKQLRYSAETAASVVGSPAERLAKAAEALQTELGDFHDAVVAEDTLRHLAPSLGSTGAFVAGRCATIEHQEALADRDTWPAAWAALNNKRRRRWLAR